MMTNQSYVRHYTLLFWMRRGIYLSFMGILLLAAFLLFPHNSDLQSNQFKVTIPQILNTCPSKPCLPVVAPPERMRSLGEVGNLKSQLPHVFLLEPKTLA